jgi:tripartite-type tricarboxylate transporter receptor subunit TctC
MNGYQNGTNKGVILVLAVLVIAVLGPPSAFSQTPFYQGKTITVIAGTSAGGTGDLRIKAMLPFLRKHIPGEPAVIMEYMDGGGGRKAANYMFRNARPDGLTIMASSGGMVAASILGESGVLYDIDKFIYLGAPEGSGHQVIYTRKDLGLDNLEKLRAASGLRIGAQTVGHTSYIAGRLFGYFIGLKDAKFIAGYTAQEVDAAILRGELDGRSNAATSVLRRNSDWLEKGIMDFHAVMEIPRGAKHPRFGHLPEIESFSKSDRESKLLTLWRTFRVAGSPYILPPGTPRERVEVLQEAMRRALRDSEFHAHYKKIVGEEADQLMPEEITKSIKDIPRDPEVVDLLKKISGGGPLPPR